MRYAIVPVPKPRQTQSDRWKKRPCVLRYRAFADEVRAKGIEVPVCGAHVTFGVPLTDAKRKQGYAAGDPHQQRFDVDNALKALLDAIYEDDCGVWDIRATKVWSDKGFIEVVLQGGE